MERRWPGLLIKNHAARSVCGEQTDRAVCAVALATARKKLARGKLENLQAARNRYILCNRHKLSVVVQPFTRREGVKACREGRGAIGALTAPKSPVTDSDYGREVGEMRL